MSLELRTALLEWAQRSAAGELPGMDWVDTEILAHGSPFVITRTDEAIRFRHVPTGKTLPPPLVEEARRHQEAGEPTLVECMALLFARAHWLVEGRGLYYRSTTPVPALLAALVEAYGVDAELHRHDAVTLANAIAHLPAFHPHRGDPERAGRLLQDVLGQPHDVDLDQEPGHDLDEVFAIRSAAWFAARPALRPSRPEVLTIRHGLLHHTAPRAPRNPEDVLVGWVPGDRFPHALLRLLPAWVSARLHEPRTS